MKKTAAEVALKILSHVDSKPVHENIVNMIIKQTKGDRTVMIKLLAKMRKQDLLTEKVKGRAHFQELAPLGKEIIEYRNAIEDFFRNVKAYKESATKKFNTPPEEWPEFRATNPNFKQYFRQAFQGWMEDADEFQGSSSVFFLKCVYYRYVQLKEKLFSSDLGSYIITDIFSKAVRDIVSWWSNDSTASFGTITQSRLNFASQLVGFDDQKLLRFAHFAADKVGCIPGLESQSLAVCASLLTIYKPSNASIKAFEDELRPAHDQGKKIRSEMTQTRNLPRSTRPSTS